MSLLLVLQVPVIKFVLGTSQVRLSHLTYGVTILHMSFLSLDCSQNDSRMTVFITKGERVFQVSIFSVVRSGNGYASGRFYYWQDSTYRPRHTYYVTGLIFVCLYVRTTLAHPCRTVRFALLQQYGLVWLQPYGLAWAQNWYSCARSYDQF